MEETITDISVSNTSYTNLNTLSGIPVSTGVVIKNKGVVWVSLIMADTQPSPDAPLGEIICDPPNATSITEVPSGGSTLWAKALGPTPAKLTIKRKVNSISSDASYLEGRRFRTYIDFTNLTLPLVLKFFITEEIDLSSSVQEIHDGQLRYRVFSGGVEGGVFDKTVPIYRVNNKTGVPVVSSGVTLTHGGTLDTAGVVANDITYLRTSGASGQTSTVAGEINSFRGFPPTTAYVVIDQISGGIGAPKGVVRYEWQVQG